MRVRKSDYLEYLEISSSIISNLEYLSLKNFNQHRKTSIYDHLLNVSIRAFVYGKKHKLDYISMTRGALLHDFYTYNWKDSNKGFRFHGFVHPKIALRNSLIYFKLNKTEIDIIKNHMFPLTLFSIPKSKESFIVSLIDKKCSILEYLNFDMRIVVYD